MKLQSNVALLVVVGAALWCATGCGGKAQPTAAQSPADSKSPSTPAEPKYATPEECFAAFAKPRSAGDDTDLLHFVTEVHADVLTGAAASELADRVTLQQDNAQKCAEVLKTHQIQGADINTLMQKVGPGKPGMEVAFAALGHSVKDKRQFFKDFRSAMGTEVKLQGEPKESDFKDLKNVKIEGDIATGTVTAYGKESEILFRREKGGWRVALHKDEQDWLKDK